MNQTSDFPMDSKPTILDEETLSRPTSPTEETSSFRRLKLLISRTFHYKLLLQLTVLIYLTPPIYYAHQASYYSPYNHCRGLPSVYDTTKTITSWSRASAIHPRDILNFIPTELTGSEKGNAAFLICVRMLQSHEHWDKWRYYEGMAMFSMYWSIVFIAVLLIGCWILRSMEYDGTARAGDDGGAFWRCYCRFVMGGQKKLTRWRRSSRVRGEDEEANWL